MYAHPLYSWEKKYSPSLALQFLYHEICFFYPKVKKVQQQLSSSPASPFWEAVSSFKLAFPALKGIYPMMDSLEKILFFFSLLEEKKASLETEVLLLRRKIRAALIYLEEKPPFSPLQLKKLQDPFSGYFQRLQRCLHTMIEASFPLFLQFLDQKNTYLFLLKKEKEIKSLLEGEKNLLPLYQKIEQKLQEEKKL